MKISKADLEAKDTVIKNLNELLIESRNENTRAWNEVLTLQEEVKKLKTEVSNANLSRDYNAKNASEFSAELEQLHALMDVFPSALPRESGEKETYQRTKYTAMTRLASWLANRGTLSVSLASKE